MLFQPLRGRLQRGVNRLMYGERDDPYAVISAWETSRSNPRSRTVLPTLVETIAQALKLPYAAILLKEGGSSDHRSLRLTQRRAGDASLVYQRKR